MVPTNLLIAFSVITLTACNSNQSSVKRTEEQNTAIANQVYEHFNKHDWERMAELYVDPADFKDPSLGQGIVKQTRLQTIAKYGKLQEISPDIRDDVGQIYPSGGKYVIVEFISSGTTPNGTNWSLPLCTIFAIENGQIIEDFTYYDKE